MFAAEIILISADSGLTTPELRVLLRVLWIKQGRKDNHLVYMIDNVACFLIQTGLGSSFLMLDIGN